MDLKPAFFFPAHKCHVRKKTSDYQFKSELTSEQNVKEHANAFLISIKIVAQMLFPLCSWVTQLLHTLKRAQLQSSPQSVKGNTTGLWTLWISPTCLHSAISLGFSWFISKNCHKPTGKILILFRWDICQFSQTATFLFASVSLLFFKINILHVTKLYFFLVFFHSRSVHQQFLR